MIVTPRISLRIALILLGAVVLEVSFFSYLSLLGATPGVLAVVVVCLGLLGGAVVGAVCGFAAGLLLDSVLLQTLGVSSLVLLAIGYLAGRYREGFEISSDLVPPLLAGGLVTLGAFGFAAIQLMLGVETQVSLLVVREILVKGILAFLFAIAVYPLLRRLLRPGLVDAAPARRRLLTGARLRRRGARRRSRASRLDGGLASRRVRGGLAVLCRLPMRAWRRRSAPAGVFAGLRGAATLHRLHPCLAHPGTRQVAHAGTNKAPLVPHPANSAPDWAAPDARHASPSVARMAPPFGPATRGSGASAQRESSSPGDPRTSPNRATDLRDGALA